MTFVAIIPARYASSRFPGKPLAIIGGRPMIQHVYDNVSSVPGLNRVMVATDDRRIVDAVQGFGGEVILTSKNHASGTERLAEVARKLKDRWVVNVQGDMPFVQPQTVLQTLRQLRRRSDALMGTARIPITDKKEWLNPHVVKVVSDAKGFALYFSRSPIPYSRGLEVERESGNGTIWGYRHLGIYVYRRDFLLKYSRLRPVPLEQTEGLEQLRALAHGYRIRVSDVDDPGIEVNTEEDLERAEAYWKATNKKKG